MLRGKKKKRSRAVFWTKVLRGKKEKKRKRAGKWECSGLKMVEERRKKEKIRV